MSISNNIQLIGISGTFSSGKDTVAEFLAKDFGFTHISTGDMVRKVAMERYGSIERPILHKTATELRAEHGAGALVVEALKEKRPLVITGIRTIGEVKELKAAGGTLLFVDAPAEVRYERMRSRERDGEAAISLEAFLEREEKEMNGGNTDADFNIRAIGDVADIAIQNIMSIDDYIATAYEKLGLAK